MLTVVVAVFSEVRGPNIQPMVNNILRCHFVDELILTVHNPDFQLNKFLACDDQRLNVVKSELPMKCSHRWTVAGSAKCSHVLVLDDDISIFPAQIKKLFLHLLREPSIPHGFAGAVSGKYLKDISCEVDDLYEAYMVTKEHINKYLEYERVLRPVLGSALPAGDFILISNSYHHAKPKTHYVGRTLRCFSSDDPEIALHRDKKWKSDIEKVREELINYLHH